MTEETFWEDIFVDAAAVPALKALVGVLAQDAQVVAGGEFARVVGFVVDAIVTGDIGQDLREALQQDAGVFALFNGAHCVVDCVLRDRVDDKVLRADLQLVKMPKEAVAVLADAVAGHREALEAAIEARRIALPSLVDVNWRVDVVISTTSMSRVFQPTLIMRLTTSKGDIRTFEVPVDKFHEIRYNVAKVLKSMSDIQANPMLQRV